MSSETPVQFKLPAPERTPRRAQRPSACMGMGMGMGGGMGMGMGTGMSMGRGMGMGMGMGMGTGMGMGMGMAGLQPASGLAVGRGPC